jgi:type 1 fimbriae regulatory protein FimB/type 1 fimbriae regulatory protein FimE
LVGPVAEKRTVAPRRLPNADLPTREYLAPAEVESLTEAAKANRWGHRDATMILAAYRHGLRASELADLRWDQIEFATAILHVRRAKRGTPATHPIKGDELRALRRLQREQDPASPFVFTSERGAPFTTAGFARMVERAGRAAKFAFKAHPHMLRHACGTRSPIRATTRGRCKPISGTGTSSIPSATPNCRRRGSRIFGVSRCSSAWAAQSRFSLQGVTVELLARMLAKVDELCAERGQQAGQCRIMFIKESAASAYVRRKRGGAKTGGAREESSQRPLIYWNRSSTL